jgi:serine/threonine-protein kinase
LVARVADELHYAHQRGIIHRDIKPANILLGAQGHPLLADFGIAVTESEMASEVATTAGTLAYMAPELLHSTPEEAAADLRTDIYSLGVVLYRLLTGCLPFAGRDLWTLRAAILAGQPAPVSQVKASIPPALAAICHRCLAQQPAARFQTAQALADALRATLLTWSQSRARGGFHADRRVHRGSGRPDGG